VRTPPSFDVLPTAELLGPLNEVERKHAPPRLFFSGDRSLLTRGTRVSIVGSRQASEHGLRNADTLARALVARGVTVVSGLAEGIDTASHEATIEAGGRTIAVIGTPLDQAYPTKNRALQDFLMRRHLAVSQFAPGAPVRRGNFPRRNRTMALLSEVTVIIEASEQSGSLHQGWEALRLGRPLFFLESLLRANLEWPHKFERYGALPLSLDDLEPFFEVLPEQARGEVAQLAF